MNRYTAHGLTLEALTGKSVIYCGLRRDCREVQDAAVAFAPAEEVAKVTRINGGERIDFHSGGRLSFASTPTGLRGRNADVVFIDYVKDAGPQSMAWWENAALAVNTSLGEVVRA